MMGISEITIIPIDFNNLKPEDVFKWLEEFGLHRYGQRYYVDPKKRDDPRYPAEKDGSPIGWYTHLGVPQQYYDETMFIIKKSDFERIKEAFLSSKLNLQEQEE